MRKHAKTFYTNKGYKLAIVFYTNFTVFKIEFRGTFFKRYLDESETFHNFTFYMKMNHFNIVFHMT